MADSVPLDEAEYRPVGNCYEDFQIGRTFEHRWGRTVTDGDNARFTTLRINRHPLYFNEENAAAHGYDDVVVDPLLVFNTILGISVEALSERGGLFLGVDDCTFHNQLTRGATLTVKSEVLDRRESSSRISASSPGRPGEYDGDGDLPVDYERTNMVPKRSAEGGADE